MLEPHQIKKEKTDSSSSAHECKCEVKKEPQVIKKEETASSSSAHECTCKCEVKESIANLNIRNQVLVNFGLNRKKVFTLGKGDKLNEHFKNYILSEPAFSELLDDSYVIFQEFSEKFGAWVDVDVNETLKDGTVVNAVFFPHNIERDEANPGFIRKKEIFTVTEKAAKRSCDSEIILIDSDDDDSVKKTKKSKKCKFTEVNAKNEEEERREKEDRKKLRKNKEILQKNVSLSEENNKKTGNSKLKKNIGAQVAKEELTGSSWKNNVALSEENPYTAVKSKSMNVGKISKPDKNQCHEEANNSASTSNVKYSVQSKKIKSVDIKIEEENEEGEEERKNLRNNKETLKNTILTEKGKKKIGNSKLKKFVGTNVTGEESVTGKKNDDVLTEENDHKAVESKSVNEHTTSKPIKNMNQVEANHSTSNQNENVISAHQNQYHETHEESNCYPGSVDNFSDSKEECGRRNGNVSPRNFCQNGESFVSKIHELCASNYLPDPKISTRESPPDGFSCQVVLNRRYYRAVNADRSKAIEDAAEIAYTSFLEYFNKPNYNNRHYNNRPYNNRPYNNRPYNNRHWRNSQSPRYYQKTPNKYFHKGSGMS